MKAMLEFSLPEEREEYETTLNGRKWRLVVDEMDEELRRIVKYNDARLADAEVAIYEKVRNMLWEKRVEYGLTE